MIFLGRIMTGEHPWLLQSNACGDLWISGSLHLTVAFVALGVLCLFIKSVGFCSATQLITNIVVKPNRLTALLNLNRLDLNRGFSWRLGM